MQGGAFWCAGETEVRVPSFRAREEEEVGYAEGTAHGGVVAELVGSPFLDFISMSKRYSDMHT